MKEFEILTINTPVKKATMKNQGIALIKGMPEVYHRESDLTEFIGEQLAGIRGVRSAHYIPICFGEYKKCLASAKYGFDRGNIRVGSPSFKKAGIKYIFSSSMIYRVGGNYFENLLDACPSLENAVQLSDEHFEMEALDVYMGQHDRRSNIYYEVYPNGEIHLAPMFDYENSMFDALKESVVYESDFNSYRTIDDYRRMIDRYPQFGEMLSSYVDVDLVKQIEEMAKTRKFDLSGFDLEPYKRFDDESHKKLELILK
jgi:hypothetical protein